MTPSIPELAETLSGQWQFQRDWAVTRLEVLIRIETRTVCSKDINSSAYYSCAGELVTRNFETVANELSTKIEELCLVRSRQDPAELAAFLVSPLEAAALQHISAISAVASSRGLKSRSMFEEPLQRERRNIKTLATHMRTSIADNLRKSYSEATVVDIKTPKRKLITAHGIRTRGDWQKTLTPDLSDSGITIYHYDYGYYSLLSFLRPSRRQRQVEAFKDWYFANIHANDLPPLFVGHSFGTYLAAEAMRKYSEIRFDRMVLCGSIVEPAYPWKQAAENGQVRLVLNEIAREDIPVIVAQWFVKDAGPSGRRGFDASSSGGVVRQITNVQHGHSDALYRKRAEAVWVPFLLGSDDVAKDSLPAPTKNPRYASTIVLALLLLIALACAAVYWARPSGGTGSSSPQLPRTDPIAAGDASRDDSAVVGKTPSPARLRTEPEKPGNSPQGSSTRREPIPEGARNNTGDRPVELNPSISVQSHDGGSDEPLVTEAPSEVDTDMHLEDDPKESNNQDAGGARAIENAEEEMFLAQVGKYQAQAFAIREAIYWLGRVMKKPLSCKAYERFLSAFPRGTGRSRSSANVASQSVSVDDAVLETAHYVAFDDKECLKRVVDLTISNEPSRLLVSIASATPSASMAERRREHAQLLSARMDERVGLIKSEALGYIVYEQYDEANYLIFMADAMVSNNSTSIPAPIPAPSFSPRWRSNLCAAIIFWRDKLRQI